MLTIWDVSFCRLDASFFNVIDSSMPVLFVEELREALGVASDSALQAPVYCCQSSVTFRMRKLLKISQQLLAFYARYQAARSDVILIPETRRYPFSDVVVVTYYDHSPYLLSSVLWK
jgi:hypothetical protein